LARPERGKAEGRAQNVLCGRKVGHGKTVRPF
jgi:hypothetical protein